MCTFEYLQLINVEKVTVSFHNFVAYLITNGTETYSGLYEFPTTAFKKLPQI